MKGIVHEMKVYVDLDTLRQMLLNASLKFKKACIVQHLCQLILCDNKGRRQLMKVTPGIVSRWCQELVMLKDLILLLSVTR